MTNEEFQKIVLEELRSLKEGQKQLETGQTKLEEGQTRLEQRQIKLEIGQEEIKKDLKAVIEQTVGLTEFRQEANEKLDILIEENDIIKEINGRHEVDIRRLKRRII